MRIATTAGLLAAGLLLAGCGTPPDPKPSAKPTPSNTWPGGLKPVDEGEKSAAPEPSALSLGKAWKWKSVGLDGVSAAYGSTAVLGYQQPVAPGALQPEETFGAESKGYVWAAAELRVCLTKGAAITVSNLPWSLSYKDGSRVQPSGTTYGGFPRPEYPYTDTKVTVGGCVRGKVVFPVPGGGRPEAVVYAPDDGRTMEWAVPRG